MHTNKQYIFFFCYFFAFVFYIQNVKAQKFTSSPYSRYGIGQYGEKTFAQAKAMGGTCIALKNDSFAPAFLNVSNPATYSSLVLSTFEAGINSTFNKFSNSSASIKSNNTSLNYLALGFPIRKSMGGCFGIMPLSSMGYNIYHTSNVSNIGDVTENYEGDGGLNQIFMGTAWRPFSKALDKYRKSAQFALDKNDSLHPQLASKKFFIKRWLSSISIGANAQYYFGTINSISRLILPGGNYAFNTKTQRSAQINSFSGSFGLSNTFTINSIKTFKRDTLKTSSTYGKRIKRKLKENIELTLGYTYSMNNSLKAYYSRYATTFLYYGLTGSEISRDTIIKEVDQKGYISLPTMHGIGFSLRKGSKLLLAADYEMQLWSGFKYFDETNYLKDMRRISVGAEYIPNKFSNAKGDYLKRIHYRIGARYNDGYLMINNNRINDYAITFGLGLPVGANKAWNMFNLSVELGQTGTISNNLTQHQYIKGTIGLTINDKWFIKYKYD